MVTYTKPTNMVSMKVTFMTHPIKTHQSTTVICKLSSMEAHHLIK